MGVQKMSNISWTMKITNQEVLRRVQLQKTCLLADIRNKKFGYFGHIIRQSTLQHYWKGIGRLLGQTKNDVDGKYNGVVKTCLCGGNTEGSRQELLTTTHCFRLSNG